MFVDIPEISPRALVSQLERLDMLNDELAVEAGVSQRTVYRWLAGTTPIPRSVMALLQLLERRA
jgi:hypothetical protein